MNNTDSQRDITSVITLLYDTFTPQNPFDPYFWNKIFQEYYSEDPEGSEDPRWDEILHQKQGMKIVQACAEKYREAAE